MSPPTVMIPDQAPLTGAVRRSSFDATHIQRRNRMCPVKPQLCRSSH